MADSSNMRQMIRFLIWDNYWADSSDETTDKDHEKVPNLARGIEKSVSRIRDLCRCIIQQCRWW